MSIWWAEGTVPSPPNSPSCAPGSHSGKAHVTSCPAHTPHVSKTLALDSQNVSPTQVLLSSWGALGSQQNRKGGQPPLANLHLSRTCLPPSVRPSVQCNRSVPSPTPHTLPHPSQFSTEFLPLPMSAPPPPCLQLPPLANPRTHTSYPHSRGP